MKEDSLDRQILDAIEFLNLKLNGNSPSVVCDQKCDFVYQLYGLQIVKGQF
jgi:hypothetical protein